MGRLAVVTCLFNPLRWRSRYAAFDAFAAGMLREGAPVYCVELLFAGQEPHATRWFPETTIVFKPEHHAQSVLFHKEALLNIGIRRALEEGFEHVAWLDADVTFSEPGWSGRIVEAFGRGEGGPAPNVVQCFSRLSHRFADRTLLKPSAAASFVRSGGMDLSGARGGAWAATRAFLERYRAAGPLYDKAVTIGGDAASLYAYARADLRGGESVGLPPFLRESPALADHWRGWAEAFGPDVRIGFADLEIATLPHGSLAGRRYADRSLYASYSPGDDVRLNERGILEWTGNNAAFQEAVLEYFKGRREDGESRLSEEDRRRAAAELWRRSRLSAAEPPARAPGRGGAKGASGRGGAKARKPWLIRKSRRLVSSWLSVLRLLRTPRVRDRRVDFVILSTYRSGSTYFASALDSHPDVVCHDELFGRWRSLFSGRLGPDPSLNVPYWARILLYRAFLNGVLARQQPSARTGYKVILQIDPRQSNQFKGRLRRLILADKGLSKIVLLRRDGLRRHLSLKIAQQSRNWHTTRENGTPRPVHFDTEEFLRVDRKLRDRCAALIRTLRRGRHPFILLHYEDLTGPGSERAFEKARRILGIGDAAMSSPYRRMNPFPLSEMIANYDEVRRSLEGTRYERFL